MCYLAWCYRKLATTIKGIGDSRTMVNGGAEVEPSACGGRTLELN